MGRITARRSVTRIEVPHAREAADNDAIKDGAAVVRRMDTLAGEEPLEIRVGHQGGPRRPLAVTMRTPGDDLDLAIGFLFTEGLIGAAEDVLTAQLCAGTDEPNTYNVVD